MKFFEKIREELRSLSLVVIVSAVVALLGCGLLVARFQSFAVLIIAAVVLALGVAGAILRKPLWGALLVIFFLPFERIGSFDIAGSTIRISQIIAFVTLVSWVLSSLGSKKFRIEKNVLTLPLSLYTIAMLLSLFNAQNLTRSVSVLVFTVFVIVISFVIPHIIHSKRHLELAIGTLLVSAVVVSLFGLYQFLGDVVGLPPEITGLREQYTKDVFGFPRIQSTALEPLYFANYLLIPIGVVFSFVLNRRQHAFSRVRLFALLLLFVLNAVLTLSRGGYLGLAATLFFVALYYVRSLLSVRTISLIAIGVVVVLIAARSFIEFSGLPRALDVFQTQAFNYSSGVGVEERFSTYSFALKAFFTHPFIGVGIGGFGPFIHPQPFKMPETGWLIVNNEPLEVLAETGLFGLASLVFAFVTLGVVSLRSIHATTDPFMKAVLVGLVGALIGVVAQYQTFSTLFILHVWVLVGLLVASIHIAERIRAPKTTHD